MQTCSTCHYESPLGAKFCRQCGAPILPENELSGAATRNYGRQEAAPRLPVSAPLPPSVADTIGADTERYARPPAPLYAQPSISTAPIQQRQRKFKPLWWLSMAIVLTVGILLGSLLGHDQSDHEQPLSPAQLAALDAANRENDLRNSVNEELQRLREQTNAQLEQQLEALHTAAEAAENASNEGALLAPGATKPLDLTPYEYPNAAAGNIIRLPGHELMTQRTGDSFDKINQYYQSKLGKPVIQINQEEEKRLLFQTSQVPFFTITVEPDDEHEGQFKIIIQRTPGSPLNSASN